MSRKAASVGVEPPGEDSGRAATGADLGDSKYSNESFEC